MINDINGKKATTTNGDIKDIEHLLEISLSYTKEPIGFLRFNPKPDDNRMSNQMVRGCWYAIKDIDKNSFILDDGKKIHFSLTNSIVSNNNDDRFERFKENSPTVMNYWKKKEDDRLKLEKTLIEIKNRETKFKKDNKNKIKTSHKKENNSNKTTIKKKEGFLKKIKRRFM